ncbi:MAG TPA: hypothetical protein VE843_01600, partial [Ktedonobacteraceae bacterium]|nr:hypothetical protein [Ktedonobacteraceae bacterium]
MNELQQFPQTTTGTVRILDNTGGSTLRRYVIPRRLIPLLMGLLLVASFFMMTGRANAATTPLYPTH